MVILGPTVQVVPSKFLACCKKHGIFQHFFWPRKSSGVLEVKSVETQWNGSRRSFQHCSVKIASIFSGLFGLKICKRIFFGFARLWGEGGGDPFSSPSPSSLTPAHFRRQGGGSQLAFLPVLARRRCPRDQTASRSTPARPSARARAPAPCPATLAKAALGCAPPLPWMYLFPKNENCW